MSGPSSVPAVPGLEDGWGVAGETGRLTDVLLCRPDNYRWLPTNVIVERTLQAGGRADTEVLDDDFTGWLAERRIRCIPVPYREAMRLGCNLLSLGDGRVLSPRGSTTLNAQLRAEGLQLLDPDLGLFTAGGGGAHCMTMPLRRL